MRTENGTIEGDLVVTGPFTLNGVVTGTVVVKAGGIFKLNGVASKLIVQDGADVSLRGVVGGDVKNEGGKLEVLGVVSGALITTRGETSVAPNAVIGTRL